jgi:hypothetical protein
MNNTWRKESSIVNPSSLIVDEKGKGKIKDEHTSTFNNAMQHTMGVE